MARWLSWLAFVVAFTLALELPVSTENLPGADTIETHRTVIMKSIHVLLFSGLTALSAWVPVPARYRWMMMFFVMCYAWATEFMQEAFDVGRTGKLSDVGFNVIGILIGVALSWKLWTRD